MFFSITKGEKSAEFLKSINYHKINKIRQVLKEKNNERHWFTLNSHINCIEDMRRKSID